MDKKPNLYLGGDIMTFGSQLAREYEYKKMTGLDLPFEIYSPILNKSINDKSNMTVEENNHLAEKITEADIERLWKSDVVVMCPEQSAIGSMCETGCLFGWHFMAYKLLKIIHDGLHNKQSDSETLMSLMKEILRISDKDSLFHYMDIRTNHLPEIDWRRSFSINQLLYGMILYLTNNEGFHSFDEILTYLQQNYGGKVDQ